MFLSKKTLQTLLLVGQLGIKGMTDNDADRNACIYRPDDVFD